ncbi:MAG: single-stranded DNA-binding protein [Methylococcaceae bacterium]|jgi:single-strand DNA-binding protein
MASRGVNKVILVGNLGADPEIRQSPNGSVVANLNIATGEAWKDQQGTLQERTEWHRVVMFGRTAEIARDYLKKGSKLYLEGRLQTRKWQDKNGQDRYTTEIVANEMQMLDRAGSDSSGPRQGSGGGYGAAPQNYGSQQPPSGSAYPPSSGGMDSDFDDDIPF